MRFGRQHNSPREESPAPETGVVAGPPAAPPDEGPRELFVRYARKEGQLVAMLRAVDHGDTCTVEAEVRPQGGQELVRPGPYTFTDVQNASAFVTEAVTALMYLGCDVQAE